MLTNDLRFALRNLRRRPFFTAISVALLALGIGVNSALFSVVKACLIEDLQYGQPNQLVQEGAERLQLSCLLPMADVRPTITPGCCCGAIQILDTA